VECHAQTLLPQYLGMYRLTVNDAETYMVAMRNVFSPRLTIHKKYDLKVSGTHVSLFYGLSIAIIVIVVRLSVLLHVSDLFHDLQLGRKLHFF
jgi:hypothetical protein